MAQTICSALKHLYNLGNNAFERLQDLLVKAISEAGHEEATHNEEGYAEWVHRILNQKQGYRLAHIRTRRTPKAPPPPNSATIDGHFYGHPSELGPKFHRDWEALW
eukprot:9391180-Karenia_brevis.AAC.1